MITTIMKSAIVIVLTLFLASGSADDTSHWVTRNRYDNGIPYRRHPNNSTQSRRDDSYGSNIHHNNHIQFNRRNSHLPPSHTGRYVSKAAYGSVDVNERFNTGIYRSYGRGKALIPRLGATVMVTNAVPDSKMHKGTLSASVFTVPPYENRRSKMNYRSRRDCFGCPQNRAVVASKGNAFVILPEPCPSIRWVPMAGPRPGRKIAEGSHNLIGRLGHRGKICQYQYEVVVRHCGKFIIDDGNFTCTADDAWGSVCNISCNDGYELVGADKMECQDDLMWSSDTPRCRKKIGCRLPQTPDDAKLWCQVPDENDLISEILPPNTYCRFKSDGKHKVITCVDGYWVNKPGHKGRFRKKSKNGKHKKTKPEKDVDASLKNRNIIP